MSGPHTETERRMDVSNLFADAYPDTDEGRATMALARVATAVEDNLGLTMDPETRISTLIETHRIEREHLPEDLLSLYDVLRSHLGME